MRKTESTQLSLSGSWEDICNNVERHNARARWEAKRQAHKRDKMKQTVVNLSLGAVLVIAMASAGLVAPWVAGTVAVLLVCGASFMGGRIFGGNMK